MAALTEPWSKRHKAVTKNDREGLQYNLSNSFAQPTSQAELERFATERGDDELIAAYRDHPLGYTPNGGSQDCRMAVAGAIFDDCGADDILITAGGQVALQTVAFALLDKDSHAVVFTPSYQSCQECPLHAGAAVTKVRLTRENNWDIDIAALEDACRFETKLILLNQPWNPAGTLMSREKLEDIIDVARRCGASGAWILADEIYRFLEHDSTNRLPTIADLYEKGVSIGALSKPFGAGGVEVGLFGGRCAARAAGARTAAGAAGDRAAREPRQREPRRRRRQLRQRRRKLVQLQRRSIAFVGPQSRTRRLGLVRRRAGLGLGAGDGSGEHR